MSQRVPVVRLEVGIVLENQGSTVAEFETIPSLLEVAGVEVEESE